MSDKLETLKCPHCKKEQLISMWLAAHWHESLIGTCEDCGKKYNLRAGRTWK